MPLRSLFPHQQQQQQLHHNHHHRHRRQEQRCHHGLRQRSLLLSSASSSSSSSSFLPSALLSAGCCAVIFLASAIAASDIDPRRQMMEPSDPRSLQEKNDHHHQHHQLHHLHPQHHQPLSDGPGSGGRGVGGGPRMSTASTKEQREEQRRVKETHIIEQIKMVILNATGQENKPLNGSLNRTGKDYQEVMRGFGNNFNFGQLPKGGAGAGGGQGGLSPAVQGNPRRPMEITNKIKEFADEVPNLIGVDGAVQFVLHPKQTPGYNGSQRVINATMKVLVRLNRHDQTPTGQQKQSRRRRRRITIVAYLLDDSAATDAGRQKLGAGAAGALDPYLPIAQLTVLVRKTNWHKVLLPTTIVQRVLDSDDKVLRLRVVCMECNDETEVVMTPRRTRKKMGGRKSTRAGRLGAGGRGGGRGGGGGGEDGQVEEKSSLLVDDGTSFASERKSLRVAPPVGEGGGSRRSPVLIVSTRSSSRARKTG